LLILLGAQSEEAVYKDLQKHLNKQPVGFPGTKSGAAIRFLSDFSIQEVRLVTKLSYKRRSMQEIYEVVISFLLFLE